MQYIVFIHSNTNSETTHEQWDQFFDTARKSGLFKGGSAIGERYAVGEKSVVPITNSIGCYMRFDAEDMNERTTSLARFSSYGCQWRNG